jgi:predicted O-methyltransferase YrrM
MPSYRFSTKWFDNTAKHNWSSIIPDLKPSRILEIGSFEGASTCFLIERLAALPELWIHCVDTWEGGFEQKADRIDMESVEARFNHNVTSAIETAGNKVNLRIHKGYSDICLAKIFSELGRNYFDFVYVDGSHEAPDVICDAVLGFRLLRVGGIMAFDDYLGGAGDLLTRPKLGIDAFTNLYLRKVQIISISNYQFYQLYVRKIAD